MSYQPLRTIFNIKEYSIIAYTDYSTIKGKNSKKTNADKKKGGIKNNYIFSESAKKRMRKYIDIFSYTIKNNENFELSFITLTISSEQKKDVNYELLLKEWITKTQRLYGKYNYIWKLEYQANKNIHYHLMVDRNMDWRIIRGIWNKTQKIHVDDYQKKMKMKYKNGFYFDENMLDKNGNIVSEEIQLKRYEKGKKANWRNPNSTDIEIINKEEKNSINSYINKYINKTEEEDKQNEFDKNKRIRYWGKSESIEKLSYLKIYDDDLTTNTLLLLQKNQFKIIKNENDKELCQIIRKENITEELQELEKIQIRKNLEILEYKKLEYQIKKITKKINEYERSYN